MSPTQRTLALLRREGGLVEVVEHWNPWSRTRKDLLGLFDVLQVLDDDMVGVQCCAGASFAARVKKMMDSPSLIVWLKSQYRWAAIHAWRKVGPRGRRKTWQVRRAHIRLIAGQPVLFERAENFTPPQPTVLCNAKETP